jgi:imidazolonepropionase-like amidohydrolase
MKTCLSLLALMAATLLDAQPPSAYAIRNARIVTVSGPVIAKGTLLIRDGVIAEVGESVTVPQEAWVIEGQGLTVYPGLIDALSAWGISPAAPAPAVVSTGSRDAPAVVSRRGGAANVQPVAHGPEERPSTSSWVRAADLISSTDARIEQGRSAGFTSAVTYPTSGIFAGQGAFVNLAGDKRSMVVAAPTAQYLTLAPVNGAFPNSLMGVIAYIRQLYLDAEHYKLERAAYAEHKTPRRPAYDRAVEGLLESPRALLPAVRAVELERMARFAAELKLDAILYGAHEAFRDADALRKFSCPLLVSLKWPERARDADPDLPESLRTLELRDRAPSTPAALVKAGVRFAFYTDGLPARDAVRAVKRALDAGLSPADAVRAMTLAPAEIYGLSDRVGSIEKGKIANLVVTDGELFQEKTKVKCIFIDGARFEPGPDLPPAERMGGGERPSAPPPGGDNPPHAGGAQ